LKAIGYAPGLAAALENFAPDVCHTHGLWLYPSVAAKNYSRKHRQPYLVSPHGMLDPWALKNSRWKKRIAWMLFEHAHLRGAHCLRALCASEADSIRQLGLGNEIAIIPNGIDLPTASPASSPPWAGLVEPGKKVLLYLSRIHPKKGLVNLLKAWATVQKSKSDWVLAIAGWDQGGHEAELKRLCAELKILFTDVREPATSNQQPATVLFLGPQFNTAKSACYHHCDAFILPSFSEGLPMVVLEAWANTKPVVMTAECNLPEGFQAGAALKIEPTKSRVAAGLNELFRMSEAERVAMGGRGRELVVARFTWPRIAQQVEEVYAWMLGGGAKPGCISGAC
jgi:poly(glycerol-phosphate) alpha-glucosyltransferase